MLIIKSLPVLITATSLFSQQMALKTVSFFRYNLYIPIYFLK